MRLSQFDQSGLTIEVSVPWLEETLWFVSGPGHLEPVLAAGVSRGRIWTASELHNLLTTTGLTDADIVTMARLKAQFDGEVVAVEPETPNGEVPADQTRSSCRTCRACGGVRFWRSIFCATTCGECHPPASPDLVAAWIKTGAERPVDAASEDGR